MAVTKIWRVRGKADNVIDYAANPEKTAKADSEKELADIERVIGYIDDENKTEKHYYTTGINCDRETAKEEFNRIKTQYGKQGGIVAIHGYQSFEEEDLSPDTAHLIGVRLRLVIVENSAKCVLVFLLMYVGCIGLYLSTRRNYRRGEEYGSAKWGDPRSINKKYAVKPYTDNKLLTQNVRIGYDGRMHRRNLNTLVIGGSGSGKTRFFCKPNIMQANTSLVILDPKGEQLRDTGRMLEKDFGYEVRVLDLINMENSHCYNPFVYLDSDNDVQRLVTNLFKATTPKGAQSNDPFWDTAAQMLLHALIFYLKYEAPEDEQNFAMVMDMIRAGEVDEDDNSPSALDYLFFDLRKNDPAHIALKYYDAYHSGAAKTLKSIQITLAARLEKFNLDSLAKLTITDDLDLSSLGEKKCALFALIPDNDTSFNFLVSILYTQLFQQLFACADQRHGGRLPVHVHFLMDEFANVSLPDDFDKILSVMRSREVSVIIILQNLAQLKALFEKQWESIVGNCDGFVYLGGNEQATHKYVSELLGKETIDTNTYNRSYGTRGNYTKNDQLQGRELLTPDEVRMIDNRFALLFIRGEWPIKDLKYDILKHPNVALTTDGKAEPYMHGEAPDAQLTVEFVQILEATKELEGAVMEESEYELLSEEDVERVINEEN